MGLFSWQLLRRRTQNSDSQNRQIIRRTGF